MNHNHSDNDHINRDHAGHDHEDHDHAAHIHSDDECTCEACRSAAAGARFWVRNQVQDGASVISAECRLTAEYAKASIELKTALEELATQITESGGVIGHIKAAAEITSVEMFSVTETAVSHKRAEEQEITVQLAAIVFLVDPDEAKSYVERCVVNPLMRLAAPTPHSDRGSAAQGQEIRD